MYEIPNFSRYYLSKDLKIFNKETGKEIKGNTTNKKYHRVTLINDNNESVNLAVHFIIATCLIKKPELVVNHKDGNTLNNKVSNLEWVTSSENRKHSFKLGNVKGNNYVQVKDNINNTILFFHSFKQCADYFLLHTTTVQARCELGEDKVWPGGLQFRSPASKEPFKEIKDIDKALLNYGTQKSVLVKNIKTGEVVRYNTLGEAAQVLGLVNGTITGHFKRSRQPIVKDIYQLKMELDTDDWLTPEKLTANYPVKVIDEINKTTKIYPSARQAALDNNIKATALAYRLSVGDDRVWKDGKRYIKV